MIHNQVARSGSLIDPALLEVTTAAPLLHHSPGHDLWSLWVSRR
jgi:hypothetical protein